MSDKIYLVTNRSASRVHYSLPELGIKSRDYQPGETKRVSKAEIENLSYIPGGEALIRDYLLIRDEQVRKEVIGAVEPEYYMTETEIKNLILYGSMDEWLDCLDFAPDGVKDLLKNFCIALPLTDTRKMKAFKEKTGIDLARAIQAKQEEEMEVAAAATEAPQRRTQATTAPEPTTTNPARRTSGSKYKVVNKS